MLVGINDEAAAPPLCLSCCHLKRSQLSHSETCGVVFKWLWGGDAPVCQGRVEKDCCSCWPSPHTSLKPLPSVLLYWKAFKPLYINYVDIFLTASTLQKCGKLNVPQPVTPLHDKAWAGDIYCDRRKRDKYQVCVFISTELMHFFMDMTYYFPSNSTTRDLRAVDGDKQHALMWERNPASTLPE